MQGLLTAKSVTKSAASLLNGKGTVMVRQTGRGRMDDQTFAGGAADDGPAGHGDGK
jgi:hypothetical protein